MLVFPSPQSTSNYFHLFCVLGAKKLLNNSKTRHIFKYIFMFVEVYRVNILSGKEISGVFKFFHCRVLQVSLQYMHWVG